MQGQVLCKISSIGNWSYEYKSFNINDFTERTSIDFSAMDLDSDIKARVSSFIHKQFGHSKRISENDKKSMVRFLSLQIQGERKRVASASSSESSSSSGSTVIITVADKCCGTDIDYGNVNHSRINNRVQHLFDKFEEYKRSSSVTPGIESRCSDTTNTPPSRVQPRSGKERPKASDVIKAPMTPSTLENVLSEVDFLLDKIIDMENEMNKCHMLLGNNEGSLSLSLLIYDLSTKNKNREKELKQEKLKGEKMLTELYENSKRITRLEQTNVQQRSLLQHQAGETEKLARDLQHRKDHIVHLEQMSRLNSDKTSPIENIKHMVRDLRHSKVNPSKAESVRTSTDSLGKSTRGGQSTSRYSPSKSMANSGPTRYSPSKSKQGQTSYSDNGISTRRNSQASNSKIIKRKI